jgi:carbamoyl-phosphate synthase large subunit
VNILILSAGRRVSLFKIFQKELKKYFPESIVYTVDANPKRSPVCQINKDHSEKIPKVYDKDYIDALLRLVKNQKIKIIIPTIDTELKVLSYAKDRFLQFDCEIVISNSKFIEQCQDKSNQKSFFETFDIKTPKILESNNLSFPAFAKPKNGSRSLGIKFIESEDDLSKGILNDKNLIFMELISKKDFKEFTVDMYFSRESQLISMVPRERQSVRDGEVSIGRTVKGNIYNTLIEKFRFVEGAHGCITAQFFYSQKTSNLLGIEINPRFGGGYPLTYNAGANFQENIIQEYALNKRLAFKENWKEGLTMLRHDSEVYVQD